MCIGSTSLRRAIFLRVYITRLLLPPDDAAATKRIAASRGASPPPTRHAALKQTAARDSGASASRFGTALLGEFLGWLCAFDPIRSFFGLHTAVNFVRQRSLDIPILIERQRPHESADVRPLRGHSKGDPRALWSTNPIHSIVRDSMFHRTTSFVRKSRSPWSRT